MNLKEPLPEKEQVRLFNQLEEDPSVKEKLVLHNLRLVLWVAKKYHKEGKTELEDLFQCGVIGLMEAIDKYEPDRGAKFSTVAIWYIQAAITRNMFAFTDDVSLDQEVGEEGDTTLKDFIEDESVNVEGDATDRVLIEQFKAAIKPKLTEYEYDVVSLCYGLDGIKCSMSEIAKKYNTTVTAVRQTRGEAIRKIRRTTFAIQIWKEVNKRTSFLTSVDYSQPRVKGGEYISPVERLAMHREWLYKRLKKLSFDYNEQVGQLIYQKGGGKMDLRSLAIKIGFDGSTAAVKEMDGATSKLKDTAMSAAKNQKEWGSLLLKQAKD